MRRALSFLRCGCSAFRQQFVGERSTPWHIPRQFAQFGDGVGLPEDEPRSPRREMKSIARLKPHGGTDRGRDHQPPLSTANKRGIHEPSVRLVVQLWHIRVGPQKPPRYGRPNPVLPLRDRPQKERRDPGHVVAGG